MLNDLFGCAKVLVLVCQRVMRVKERPLSLEIVTQLGKSFLIVEDW